MTMKSVSENNPPSNLRQGTQMPVKILVSTPKLLAKLQKILRKQPYFNQLDRYFASQVQDMKEKGHPLEGLISSVQSK